MRKRRSDGTTAITATKLLVASSLLVAIGMGGCAKDAEKVAPATKNTVKPGEPGKEAIAPFSATQFAQMKASFDAESCGLCPSGVRPNLMEPEKLERSETARVSLSNAPSTAIRVCAKTGTGADATLVTVGCTLEGEITVSLPEDSAALHIFAYSHGETNTPVIAVETTGMETARIVLGDDIMTRMPAHAAVNF